MKQEIELRACERDWIVTLATGPLENPTLTEAVRFLLQEYRTQEFACREMNWADRQDTIEQIYDKADELFDQWDVTSLREGIKEISYLCDEFIADCNKWNEDEE